MTNKISQLLFGRKKQKELWYYVIPNLHCCSNISLKDTFKNSRQVTKIQDADIVIILGPISIKMANRIKEIYKAIVNKKYILKIGNCNTIFQEYSINLKNEIPVDFEINSCPCTVQLVNDVFEKIREKI